MSDLTPSPTSVHRLRATAELLSLCREPDLAAAARPGLATALAPHLAWLRSLDIDSLYYLAFRPDAPEQALYDRVWRAQRDELTRVLSALAAERVRAIVFKGAEFLSRYWSPHALASVSDGDFLVAREELGAAARLLYELGYSHWFCDDAGRWREYDLLDVAYQNATHDHELWTFRRLVPLALDAAEVALARQLKVEAIVWVDETPALRLDIDLHHNIGSEYRIDHLLGRLVPSALGAGHAFSPTDHLWLAAVRYYQEASHCEPESLRHWAYLVPLLARERVDWDLLLVELLERNAHVGGAPAGFYLLGALARVCGADVPPDVLAALAPRAGHRRDDWGWQLGKQLGFVEPCPLVVTRERDGAVRARIRPQRPGRSDPGGAR